MLSVGVVVGQRAAAASFSAIRYHETFKQFVLTLVRYLKNMNLVNLLIDRMLHIHSKISQPVK